MFSKMKLVWLVAGRELRDQFRDWRVLAPMLILTFGFPFLMNAFAKETVNFLNRYNANLILERLVPFSIMIIGFFPLTVSLVAALESFVGEKERGTIEPLLSAPFDDWQLYAGKLLVGVMTPLLASYVSIGFYVALILQQENLPFPPGAVMAQLLLLTAAHAFLMVSAAIVISVQSTSVKAANLLASFVVIPVALLMQGEAVMFFWGNVQVLWLAVIGVFIVSALLIRLGVAHFEREYLLGREIDTLNLKWMWTVFWRNFSGGAQSLKEWYRVVVFAALRRMSPALLVIGALAFFSVWASYAWVIDNFSDVVKNAPMERLGRMEEKVRALPSLANLRGKITAPFLFLNNTRATLSIFVFGSFSFGVIGVALYMLNVGLIGGLYALLKLLGMNPLSIFVAGVLPHGMFEIPALILGSAATLYFGVTLVTPQTGQSMGEVILGLLADWAKIFIGFVLPLLAVAALIEAYLTPVLLMNAIR